MEKDNWKCGVQIVSRFHLRMKWTPGNTSHSALKNKTNGNLRLIFNCYSIATIVFLRVWSTGIIRCLRYIFIILVIKVVIKLKCSKIYIINFAFVNLELNKDKHCTLHHGIGLSVVPKVVDNFHRVFLFCLGLGPIQWPKISWNLWCKFPNAALNYQSNKRACQTHYVWYLSL